MKQIDLHVHTSASDGDLKPEELVDLAVRNNLKVIAITDHDTISGVKEAVKYSIDKNIKIIGGVELSCFDESFTSFDIHILGLFIDLENEHLSKFLNTQKESRKTQKKAIIEKLNNLGYKISFDELKKEVGDSFGRPHIAKLLIKKYPQFKDIKQVFDELLAKNKEAYVDYKKPSIEEGINIIKKANGLPVLAHPGVYLKKAEKIIEKFAGLGGKGIEIDYPYDKIYSLNMRIIDGFKILAEKFNLMQTGGSDFHGKSRNSFLGDAGLNEDEFNKILEIIKNI